MTDLSLTIAPKSDNLTADDLIGGPITVRVTAVSAGADKDRPIDISYEGDGGKPYRPCLTMRRVLVAVWGKDGNAYVGRRMTLYRDETVRYGGLEIGGVRISHVSHITRPITIALTETRQKKRPYTVQPLVEASVTETTERKPRQSTREWLAELEMDLTNAATEEEALHILGSEEVKKVGDRLQGVAKEQFETMKKRALVRFPPSEPPEIEGEQWAAA